MARTVLMTSTFLSPTLFNTISNNGTAGIQSRAYGVARARKGTPTPEQVTLIGNTISGNAGKVKSGKSDLEVKNYDQIFDATDNQPPYTP